MSKQLLEHIEAHKSGKVLVQFHSLEEGVVLLLAVPLLFTDGELANGWHLLFTCLGGDFSIPNRYDYGLIAAQKANGDEPCLAFTCAQYIAGMGNPWGLGSSGQKEDGLSEFVLSLQGEEDPVVLERMVKSIRAQFEEMVEVWDNKVLGVVGSVNYDKKKFWDEYA